MKKFLIFLGILALFVLNVFMGTRLTSLEKELNALKAQQTTPVVETKNNEPVPQPTVVQMNDSSISDVYKKVENSVVTVINEPYGSGSGVIYSVENGKAFVITNHHVVADAETLSIILNSGEEIEAKLIGSDELADIALLEIKTDLELVPIELGDSSLLQVGETVLAIGSPRGANFSGSLSVGVISGKDRAIEVDTNGDRQPDWEMILVQTDAAINPGNSGGALVNMKGQLIGINTLKLLDLSVEGMGFANPVNEVMHIVQQLKEQGKVTRPMIGISSISMQDLILRAKFFNLEIPNVEYGIYVNDVLKDSPADLAGIQEGDVIIEFNHVQVKDFKEFRRQLYQFKPNDKVEVTIVRNNETIKKSVTLK